MSMKKLAMILAGAVLSVAALPALAGNDRPISLGELPAASQQFVRNHFQNVKVSYAKVDGGVMDKDYTVVFVDGSKVEFNKNGEWKEVESKFGMVPEAIVPPQIGSYVAAHFEGRRITDIERTRRGYEVVLDNGIELDFNNRFQVTKIDD